MSKYDKLTALGNERPRKRKKRLDRLTRDAIAAQKAGMTYGKYKALHPHTPDEDDEVEALERVTPGGTTGTCENCGATFDKKRYSRKRYCCDACRVTAHGKKTRETRARPGKPTLCRICGKEFLADYQHRVYCGKECYAEGQRQRQKQLKTQYKEIDIKNGRN